MLNLGIFLTFPSPIALLASLIRVWMPVPEYVSEVEIFHTGNDLASGLGSVLVSIEVVVIFELGEYAYIPVSHNNHVLLGVKDSIVKDFLREEGCIVALFFRARRTIHRHQYLLCLPEREVIVVGV